MLDRTKVVQALNQVSNQLFKPLAYSSWLNRDLWKYVTNDARFLCTIEEARETSRLVSWEGALSSLHSEPEIKRTNYSVLAVDGSQIYPDHHINGVDCFLINAAGCLLSYGLQGKATFFSEPFVYIPEHLAQQFPGMLFSTDCVDLLREDHEFLMLIGQMSSTNTQGEMGINPVALFDGNLLFWHLESKGEVLKRLFIKRYTSHLKQLHQANIIHAGYLSSSKFRDLCRLFEIGLGHDARFDQQRATLPSMTDAELLHSVLEYGERTIIFRCNSAIVDEYSSAIKPCFFYLNVGSEIVRIEVPLWIAQQEKIINFIVSVCLDQCSKGQGYPVALAEAHAQAVVKSSDRDFFYQIIARYAVEQRHRVSLSPKSLKKRAMNI